LNIDESYSELGLTPTCSDAEVKAAWRRLAARWHPDRNRSPQALRKIQRINRAVEEIRKAREGLAGADLAQEEEPPLRTMDHAVSLTLEEAMAGCSRELEGVVSDPCAPCAGTGLQARASTCSDCGGSGRVRQPLLFSWFSPLVECGSCDGRGSTRHACPACEGRGKASARKYRCRIDIPAGVRDGHVLHLEARVQRGPQLALRVRMEVEPHEFFTVDADGTVKCELPVDGFAWIANRWIEVPTPCGLQQMRLRRDYLVYRIKGKGFPLDADGRRGDCMVTVIPLFPEELTARQEAQIDRLIESNSRNVASEVGGRVSAWGELLDAWQSRLPT
jgi:molecular chaperone DnaJ